MGNIIILSFLLLCHITERYECTLCTEENVNCLLSRRCTIYSVHTQPDRVHWNSVHYHSGFCGMGPQCIFLCETNKHSWASLKENLAAEER